MATGKALHFFDREAISTVQLLEDRHEWEVQYKCPQLRMLFLIKPTKLCLWRVYCFQVVRPSVTFCFVNILKRHC